MRILLLMLLCSLPCVAGWKAGAGKVSITPTEPIWLAGYGNRDRPSESVLQDIWVKAAAFQDDSGAVSVITTADLVGLDVQTLDVVSARVKDAYGIPRERLIFNYSHNHSCPVTGDVLHLYYPSMNDQQRAAVKRYTGRLYQAYFEAIAMAVRNLAPVRLEFEQGLAGLAVNRRRARPGGRKLPGPVDPDVPVLAARDEQNQLRVILFGYSCHATAISGQSVNGDYPGYAQVELETAYPGSVALFVMGCGGDANPLPRIMGSDAPDAVALAAGYGKILATAVKLVINGKMRAVAGPLKVAYTVAQIPFERPPAREELREQQKTLTGNRKRYNEYLLSVLERDGKLQTEHLYPVQAWNFGGSLTLIALTGETVVDYCLRFKQQYGWENTWVAGYNNELVSYIPSLRVLKEGGYEGTEGVYEYGLPGPYAPAIEQVIADKVEEAVRDSRVP